jgi:hypothetical protein
MRRCGGCTSSSSACSSSSGPSATRRATCPLTPPSTSCSPYFDAQARLARNRLRVRLRSQSVFIAVRRDVFKFAMLNLYIAVHEQLGEGGGCMVIECDTDGSRVTLRIVAEPETEARGGSTGDGVAGSVEFAAALLAPCRWADRGGLLRV